MRLKLWEQNFLLTFAVFFTLLNLCLVIVCLFSFEQNYMEFTRNCRQEAENILQLEKHIQADEINEEELAEIVWHYAENQTYVKLSIDDNTYVNNLPTTETGKYYRLDLRYEDCQLQYMKPKEGVFQEYRNLLLGLGVVDAALASLIGALLYLSMKSIYKPVSNIAHELRTPLTSILGYAQLISMDFVSKEEQETAATRIESEAKYMRDIVENLLTMDSIAGYRVELRKQEFDDALEDLKAKYPEVVFENELDTIMAERTLLNILLSNLLENAVREDAKATFRANKYRLEISNRTKDLTAGDVSLMNQGRRLDYGQIKGYGIGMELCFEIVKAHGWRLEYVLTDGMLTAVVYLV